ncbi:Uncharacterised protein g2649 [Pycnogonum litorale]
MNYFCLPILLFYQSISTGLAQQAQCDTVIPGTKPKIIFTPNYPDDYDNYRTCSYVIERTDSSVCKVQLEVIDFSLESDNSCSNDYLDLGDGYTGVFTQRRLCGNIIANTKKELSFSGNRNRLTMRFNSDGTGSSRGFSIKVTQVRNSCYGGGGVASTRSPLIPTGCDFLLQGEYITITSPNYPNRYRANENCFYRVNRLDGTVCQMTVNFDKFDLGGQTGNCLNDYFLLPSGERLCGRQRTSRTLTVQPSDGTVTFQFHSDGYDERQGFRISIQQKRNSCQGAVTRRPDAGSCRTELRDLTQTITSPGFPSSYPARIQCHYIIKRYNRNICRIELDIESFDLTTSTNCAEDYLQLPNGDRLCGRTSGRRLLDFGNRNEVAMIFNSGSQARFHSGFQIQVRQIVNSCSGGGLPGPPPPTGFCNQEIRDRTTTIRSPGYSGGRYANNLRCVYTIRRYDSTTCQVELDVNLIDVEDSFSCVKDSLRLPNGLAVCGRNQRIRKVLTYPSGNRDEVQVEFRTDGYGTGAGFEIGVRQLVGSCVGTRPTQTPGGGGGTLCGRTFSTERFHIKSPGFQQGNYANNQKCEYKVNKIANNVCALQITYNKFDLEESDDCSKDYFEVDGVKNCGRLDYDSVRTYRFTRDTETLTFRSDHGRTSSGFFLTAKQLRC